MAPGMQAGMWWQLLYAYAVTRWVHGSRPLKREHTVSRCWEHGHSLRLSEQVSPSADREAPAACAGLQSCVCAFCHRCCFGQAYKPPLLAGVCMQHACPCA